MFAWHKFHKTVLFIFKTLIHLLMGSIFFKMFGLRLPQLNHLSRTLGITLATFYVSYLFSQQFFGKFDIDVRKSKFVIISLSLAVFLADIFTYVALLIMNIGASARFALNRFGFMTLISVIIFQYLAMLVTVHLSSYIYFLFYPAETTCLVINQDLDFERYLISFKKYQKQYQITEVVDYRSPAVFSAIDQNERIFLLDLTADQRSKVLNYCYQNWKKTSFTPDVLDIAQATSVETVVDDFIVINFAVHKMTIEQRIIKRLLDIFVSLIAIILTLPLWALIAIAIKIEDQGSIFYRQKRMTIDRNVFNIYKFRSMYENRADMSFKQAVVNDQRITKVGRIIRRFRLDELPQFINVLNGEMSVVGPRPEAEESYLKITKSMPEFAYRTRMKAGITGLAQIYGKYNTPPINKLKFDLFYIENFSIWLDIKLIFQTLTVFFQRESVEMNQRN